MTKQALDIDTMIVRKEARLKQLEQEEGSLIAQINRFLGENRAKQSETKAALRMLKALQAGVSLEEYDQMEQAAEQAEQQALMGQQGGPPPAMVPPHPDGQEGQPEPPGATEQGNVTDDTGTTPDAPLNPSYAAQKPSATRHPARAQRAGAAKQR
jgi:hypothetical protein